MPSSPALPSPAPSAATLLLLTDRRLPTGAPEPGDEVAPLTAAGIRTLDDLRRFLDVRLHTTGLVDAAVAAAAAATGDTIALGELDVAASARLPSPAARQASHRRARQLLRAAATAWPSPVYRRLSGPLHHAVALGIVARVGGLAPIDAAQAAAHGAVSDPAMAAVRLLGFDPLAAQAVLIGLVPRIDQVAAAAAAAAERGRIPVPPATPGPGTGGPFRSATASGNRELIRRRQPRNIAGLP